MNNDELLQLIKDELNVKEIVLDENIEEEVEFDITLTEELKEEGAARELIRAIQDMRKKSKLTPSDKAVLAVGTDDSGKKMIDKFSDAIKSTTLLKEIKFTDADGDEININSYNFKLKILK